MREVIVLADGDDPGEAAARNCALRWTREGRRVLQAVRAYLRRGHEVLPVNPRLARDGARVEGLGVYADVSGPPGPIDRQMTVRARGVPSPT